ncbi:hypothetical protein [Candidatus Lokiarchaeum ossiferum]|uniref:hypothetical protein n=1 Tax=Candidatus Lokiarchaeum ossiferum TaxID=2951803 RepID=UPI00352E6248
MQLEANKRLAIFGKTRKGKTYWLKKHIFEAAKHIPVIICDMKLADFSKVPIIKDLTKFDWNVKTGVYRFRCFCEDDLRKFNKIAWEKLVSSKTRRAILVYDEISVYIENNSLKKFPYMKKLTVLGAAFGIGIWYATQRPAMLDKTLLSECKYVVSFQMDSERDRLAIANYFDPDDIMNLKKYWYYAYNDETGVSKHAPI